MEKVTKGLTNWLSSEGMTQKDVAEKLGVSEQFVNALFNGRREFGKKTANDWQKLFGLSASWLRTGEGKMLADDEAVANTDAIPEYDIDFSCGNAVMYADGSAPIVGSVRMPEYAGASAIVRATGKETIAEALGHSVATVTDIYIKFNRRKIDEANRRVIDLLK